jgi:hypothetical protein
LTDKLEPEAQARKKPYTKPAVAKVPLAPEEAVLGACKSGSTRGPVAIRCSTPFACRTIGS